MAASKVTIWKLVQKCAEQLTHAGQTPFTRGELIRCVRKTNPEYDENSINPIIQGVTDNLRGGAPGAVGMNILHSVARGQFVLNSSSIGASDSHPMQKAVVVQARLKAATPPHSDKNTIALGTITFKYVTFILAERDSKGRTRRLMPQARYENRDNLPLNRYGNGPFCKFSIPNSYSQSGVYVLTVNDAPKYVGECTNLSQRFNMGYGNISPRNCYAGGQETNCRINNLLYRSMQLGHTVVLWFYPTSEYKAVESTLRATYSMEWNRA